MTRQEETQKKQLEKISEETEKGLIAGLVDGIACYKVTDEGIKWIPLDELLSLEKFAVESYEEYWEKYGKNNYPHKQVSDADNE